MLRADVIYLIAEDPARRGVFDAAEPTEKQRLCVVRSVGMNEFYKAAEAGLAPTVCFILADFADYAGERLLRWGDRRYQIVRTYVDGTRVELYAEEVKQP